MEEFIVKILPQVPPMGLMVVVVLLFLKAMEKRDVLFANTMKENTETIRHASDKTATALNKLSTTIEAIKLKSGL